jgi:hypothetical protein
MKRYMIGRFGPCQSPVIGVLHHSPTSAICLRSGRHVFDGIVGGGASGTVMEAGVLPKASARGVRDFSEEDALILQELLNWPDGRE